MGCITLEAISTVADFSDSVSVTVILHEPSFSPVAMPVAPTLTILVLEDVHCSFGGDNSTTALAALYAPTLICCVESTATIAGFGVNTRRTIVLFIVMLIGIVVFASMVKGTVAVAYAMPVPVVVG